MFWINFLVSSYHLPTYHVQLDRKMCGIDALERWQVLCHLDEILSLIGCIISCNGMILNQFTEFAYDENFPLLVYDWVLEVFFLINYRLLVKGLQITSHIIHEVAQISLLCEDFRSLFIKELKLLFARLEHLNRLRVIDFSNWFTSILSRFRSPFPEKWVALVVVSSKPLRIQVFRAVSFFH